MKLASGAARVGAMRAAGIRVGLGSDGEKENNSLDLLEEMKFAALLQKASTLDPTSSAWTVGSTSTVGTRPLSSNGAGSYAKDSGQAVEVMRSQRPGQRPVLPSHSGRAVVVALPVPMAREAKSCSARPGCYLDNPEAGSAARNDLQPVRNVLGR
jgi:hypothetical protein